MPVVSASRSALLPQLASYLPRFVVERLAVRNALPVAPVAEVTPAAVLFTDISGFTPLVERFAAQGASGVERLSQTMNRLFGLLVELVYSHGGDVIRFPGDAAIAVWPSTSIEALTDAVQLAAQCALAIQKAFEELPPIEGTQLRVRSGVSAGLVSLIELGGFGGRWEYLAAGDTLRELGATLKTAKPGEAHLAATARKVLAERATGSATADGTLRLTSLTRKAELPPFPQVPEAVSGLGDALRGYVPEVVVQRLKAGQESWLGELRRVVVLFLELRGCDVGQELDRAHAAVRCLQEAVAQYEGAINQLVVDDKGTVLVAGWGLPSCTHEDDAVRALQAALQMQTRLAELEIRCSIGLASGSLFCGERADPRRREYAMVGSVVNLAARLMQAADGGLIADATVAKAVSGRVALVSGGTIAVKGRADRIEIYVPPSDGTTLVRRAVKSTSLIGRTVEREALAEELVALQTQGGRRLVVVEGEAGIGKSVLLEHFLQTAEAAGLLVARGAGDALERTTPWLAWRELLGKALGVEGLKADACRTWVLEHLPAEKREWAPLLNAVLPLELPVTETMRQMTGQVRADLTRDLVVSLLQAVASKQPMVLIIDDIHWLDSVSLSLAEAVHRRVPNLLLALFSRPHAPPVPLEYAELRQAAGARLLTLANLSPQEALDLVCRRLGVESLPAELAAFIRSKAEGHPFFSEELAYALSEAGVITIADGVCRLAEAVDLTKLSFPDTVQGVISSRIDRLSAQEQLTLKVASVIGRLFQVGVLRDVHPVEADRGQLDPILSSLSEHELTQRESGAEPVYLFKHVITQEVSYGLLLPSQKRQLHQRVAECLEQGVEERNHAVLAHHWQLAGDIARALDALETAGSEALAKGANREAAYFLERAIELAPDVEPTRLVRWRRQLGEAYFGLGNIVRSRQEYGHGLARVGRSIPRSTFGMQTRVAIEFWRQVAYRVLPKGLYRQSKEHRRATLIETARMASTVGEQYFNDSHLGGLLAYGLMAINAAESTGEYEPAMRSYSGLAHICGVMGLKGVANRWLNHVDQVAKSPEARASSAIARACLHLYAGRSDEALASGEASTKLARSGGDRSMTVNALVVLSTVQHYRGDWAAALASTHEVIELGQQRSNKEHEVWGLISLAIVHVHRGEHAVAVKAAEDAVALLPQTDHNGRVCCYGSAALAHARQGDLAKAQSYAEAMLASMKKITTPAFTIAWPLVCLIETLHLISAREGLSKERLKQLDAAQAMLNRIAFMFPFCRARAALMMGQTLAAQGKTEKARQQWQKAIRVGEPLGSVFEVALARLQLARTSSDAAERQALAQQAREVFAQLGAAYHLQEAESVGRELALATA